MNDLHDGQFNFEPLGSGFDASDWELDSLLADALRDGFIVPAGLPDRVFYASASLLPVRAIDPPLKLVGTSRERIVVRRRLVSRIAMAASVALAGAIGLKVCMPTAAGTQVAASDADWAVFEELDASYGSVSQLFETEGMTLDDVTSELTMLVRASESEL